MDDLVAADKRRGLVLGLVCGEALGRTGEGLTRDAILRQHGRIVRIPRGSEPGPLARALLSPGDDEGHAVLLEALLGAAAAAPERRDGQTSAGRHLQRAARFALASEPLRRLDARLLLETLGGEAATAGERQALAVLAAQALSPPAPDAAMLPLEATGPGEPLLTVLLAVHSLLVRPRSLEEAVVYAVNLGGRSALRGALAAALAGAHRGAAGIPERWREAMGELKPWRDLADRLEGRPPSTAAPPLMSGGQR